MAITNRKATFPCEVQRAWEVCQDVLKKQQANSVSDLGKALPYMDVIRPYEKAESRIKALV